MFRKEKIKDLHYSISGILTAAEIWSAADEILQKYSEKAKIPGFRPGHIPTQVLRQKYGEAAYAEAADQLMNDQLRNYCADKKIRLAAAPKADVVKLAVNEDMEFSLEFDILPTLPPIDLEKFSVMKKVAEVPASEIEKSLENLRKSRASFVKQDAGYKAENGDTVVIDFKGFLGSEPFDGGEAKNHSLILGSGSFIPGFEDKLIGHKSGEEFDLTVKFPKDYHSEKLAGKDAKFAIVLHEIRKPVLPELNDELAKSVGRESVADLRKHIGEILKEQYQEASQREMRSELLDILADKVRLELPESLVLQEYQMAKMEHDRHEGHEHAKNEKWDEKKERKEAERRVKLGLVLAEWGGANGVSVSDQDLQQAIWAEASRYPDPQQVFNFYNQNPNAISMVRGMLFEQKALDAMLAKVKTKEKTVKPEDLFQQAAVK